VARVWYYPRRSGDYRRQCNWFILHRLCRDGQAAFTEAISVCGGFGGKVVFLWNSLFFSRRAAPSMAR